MNKILLVSKILLSLLLLCCTIGAFATDAVNNAPFSNLEEDMVLVDRLNNLNSSVDVRYTKEVKDRIHNYVTTYPRGSEMILGRVSMYFPMVENEIRANNLPEDLKYLAVVESALKASAKSKSGAAGLWQFMKGTGKMYGLSINGEIDERCDALKSTKAALTYLEDLYNQFDDWTLALAAYNCGPGNVRKAIRKSGGKRDYWEIRSFLPSETREYIPRFIAASYMVQYHYAHDLNAEVLSPELTHTTTLKVSEFTSFNKLSQRINVSMENLKYLNPSYLKSYIPSSQSSSNYLTIPASKLNTYFGYEMNYDQIVFTINKNGLIFKNQMRQVKRIAQLPRLNLSFEKDLMLDLKIENASPMRTSLRALSSATEIRRDFYIYHELKKRESLYDLVKKYDGVTIESLMELNNFDSNKQPSIGFMVRVKRKT